MQLRQKELELEGLRCQPEHEKDQEIQRLRSALEEKERAEATRAVLCASLAEEADGLRNQLGATVKVCQKLLARLEEKMDKKGEAAEEPLQQVGVSVPSEARVRPQTPSKLASLRLPQTVESSDVSGLHVQIRRLQAENKQLKERVAYVSVSPAATSCIHPIGASDATAPSSGARFELPVAEVRLQQGGLHPRPVSPAEGDERAGLSRRRAAPSGDLQAQRPTGGEDEGVLPAGEGDGGGQEAGTRARPDAGAAGGSHGRTDGRSVGPAASGQTERAVVSPQVLIYAEDFKSERADRERAQGHIDDLKEQVYQLKEQLHKQVRRRDELFCASPGWRRLNPVSLAVFSKGLVGRRGIWFPCAAYT